MRTVSFDIIPQSAQARKAQFPAALIVENAHFRPKLRG